MKKHISIIDYGLGNLLSVERAFEHCGAQVNFVTTPEQISKSDRLVLPGVGAFGDGMNELQKRNLVPALKAFTESNRPLLGICLGMQLLFDESEEFGQHKGLGIIPGRVVAIPKTDVTGNPHKIPHIGWAPLVGAPGSEWKETILKDLVPGKTMYFVHSYSAMPESPENRLSDSDYNGRVICAVVRRGSVYGCQFHPEKSGENGLSIVRSFCSI